MSPLIKSINGSGIEQFLYNPVFFTVASIFFALGILLSFQLIKKYNLKVDKNLVYILTPFILTGIALEPYFTFLHSIIFIIASFLTYIAAVTYFQNINRYATQLSVLGLTTLAAAISLYSFENLEAISYSFLITLTWAIPALVIELKTSISEKILIPIAAHFLDASTTFSIIKLGGSEKHFYAGKFIEILGAPGIFVFKALVIVPITFYIYRNFEQKERNYYLYVIAVIGVGLALRNILEAL